MTMNIMQKIDLQAATLLTGGLVTTEIIQECDKVIAGEDQAELKALIEAAPDLKAGLDELGAEFPHETIEVRLTLGSFFYSLLCSQLPRPTAPLKIIAYNETIQSLAEKFNSSEFEVKPEELSSLRRIMDSDELWGRASVAVSAGKNDHKVPIRSDAVSLFKEVIAAAVEVFREADAQKDKEKAEFAEKKKQSRWKSKKDKK